MAKQLASKVIIQEEVTSLRNIPAAATAIIGVCGVAERGPIATATLVTSWKEYVDYFGTFSADGELPMAVRGIYKQDRGAWVQVVRTVHYDPDATSKANKQSAAATVNVPSTTAVASAGQVIGNTAGPWRLSPGQTLDIHVDEDVGGSEVATFDAAQATLAGGAPAIAAMTGKTVIFELDGTGIVQTVTFTAGAVSLATVLTELNQQSVGCYWIDDGAGNIDVFSDVYGTDSEVDITGGTGLTEIGHSVATSAPTVSDVANITTVTLAEIQAVLATDITAATVTASLQAVTGYLVITSDTVGASSSVQIEVASTATAFGFDNALHSGSATSSATTFILSGRYDGTYAENYSLVVSAPTSGDTDYFDCVTLNSDGVAIENFPNVQLTTPADSDYIETVINAAITDGGSKYFTVADQLTTDLPDYATYTPASGDDGLTSLDDNDFLGDSAGGTGLHAFDALLEDITILTVPGQASNALHNGMITYVESDKDGLAFAVLDPPANLTAQQMVTYTETTASLIESSEYAAIYWPRIKVLNPSKPVYGNDDEITVPPAAWIAGVYSRNDSAKEGGIYKPPAGIDDNRGVINGHLGFETDEVMDVNKRDLLYPKLINPISKEKGTPRFIDGTKTLKEGGDFPSVSERRGVIFIETSIKRGTTFARHTNVDTELLSRVFRTVYQFLKQQMKLSAFRTKNPSTAFFVDVSEALNPPSEQFAQRVNGRVGLATQKPANWVIFTFSQDTRLLDEELAVG
jgi:hypothetical protein